MMLGLFPAPYPDELLYSICARYSALFDFPTLNTAIGNLFGPVVKLLPIELPKNLSYLISVIPGKHNFTIDRIINNHTMLPYYARFMPQKRLNTIITSMATEPDARIYKITITKLVKHSYYLRFCPLCSIEDFNKFGEYYWHRKHQLQGIEVCYQHKVFLESTSVKIKRRNKTYELINANDEIKINKVHYLDTNKFYHQVLLQLAKDATWLLEMPISNSEYELLHNRYYQLFIKKGFARLTGVMRVTELVEQVRKYFSQTVLKKLHCGIHDNVQNWVYKFLSYINMKKGIHPVLHLLMLQFLDIKASEFFQLKHFPINKKPFGDGPWPCLDRTSDHYRELTINKYDKINLFNNGANRKASFRCDCGFAYNRIGPDRMPKDKYRYDQVTSFSDSWVNKLRELMADKSLSIKAIAKQLGVDVETLNRNTKLLKSHSAHNGFKNRTELAKKRKFKLLLTFKTTLKQSRKELIEFLKSSPGIKRKALYTTNRRLTDWLRKYDREWFEKTCTRLLKNNNINWQKRDIELSNEIRNAAKKIINNGSKPVRVTVTGIFNLIKFNRNMLISDRKKYLPLSLKTIQEVLETHEAYVLRKMTWVVALYQKSGKLLTRHRFQRKICSDPTLLKYDSVKKEVDSTLDKLIFKDQD